MPRTRTPSRGWPIGRSIFLVATCLVGARGGSTDASIPMAAPADPWRGGRALAIAVESGHASFDLPRADPGTQTLVIVSSLHRGDGTFPIRLAARPVDRAAMPSAVAGRATGPPRLDSPRVDPVPEAPLRMPPPSRTFHLMVRDGSVTDASRYLGIDAQLRAVGRRVQVYVDPADVKAVDAATLKDVVETFDRRIYPAAATRFGPAADVDRDERFTILISGWLGKLAGGKVSVDGFVKGADLDRTLAGPFSNHADMMYLNARLKAGPHLRTIMAHEYIHAVTFSRKSLDPDGIGPGGAEEDGWLDEAYSHLFEDSLGFSRTNIDYRVSAFLSQPERYRLVVDDYYAANLFRGHGNRGACYMFLRWCVDRYGPGLLDELVRSRRRGVENLEVATGSSFEDLFRRWTVALYLGGLDPGAKGDDDRYRSIDPRGGLEDWILAGPRAASVGPGGSSEERWASAGTAARYCLVAGGPDAALRVTIDAPADAGLQVTAVRLPQGLGRQELTVRPTLGPDGSIRVLARLAELDGLPIRLDGLAWEPLVPASNPAAPGFRRGGLDPAGIAAAFGTVALGPRGSLRSRAITLDGVGPGSGPIVFKAVGTDPHGRRVAAWTVIDPAARPDPKGRDGLNMPGVASGLKPASASSP